MGGVSPAWGVMGYGEVGVPALLMRGVEASWAGLGLLEGLLDRLVAGEVDLDRFHGVGRVWTFPCGGSGSHAGLS